MTYTPNAHDQPDVFIHGTYKEPVCGCRIGDNVTLSDAPAIVFCPLHAAAPLLYEACRAGGEYSNALRAYQGQGIHGQMVPGTDELERLFLDWHDKTHAALAQAERRE